MIEMKDYLEILKYENGDGNRIIKELNEYYYISLKVITHLKENNKIKIKCAGRKNVHTLKGNVEFNYRNKFNNVYVDDIFFE